MICIAVTDHDPIKFHFISLLCLKPLSKNRSKCWTISIQQKTWTLRTPRLEYESKPNWQLKKIHWTKLSFDEENYKSCFHWYISFIYPCRTVCSRKKYRGLCTVAVEQESVRVGALGTWTEVPHHQPLLSDHAVQCPVTPTNPEMWRC